MSAQELQDVLAALPELSLIGTTLLSESASVGFFPADVPRDTLREAVAEMVAYTEACGATTRRLRDLTPIPLTVPVEAYAL